MSCSARATREPPGRVFDMNSRIETGENPYTRARLVRQVPPLSMEVELVPGGLSVVPKDGPRVAGLADDGSAALVAALRRMARAVSETLELKDVFARVAEAAATTIPFEGMAVIRVERPGRLSLYSLAPSPNGVP